MLKYLNLHGWLNEPVEYKLGSSVSIVVPIGRNGYDDHDLRNYETCFLTMLSTAIGQTPGPFTLIDVGADIGVFSLKLLAFSAAITEVVAFEPNTDGFHWLKLNLDRLDIPATAVHAAAADFEGNGRLVAPGVQSSAPFEANHTQCFLEPFPAGPVTVTKIDSLAVSGSGNVVIKIDVEGGELAALRGAARTITDASNVIVGVEAHPEVATRTGVDPVECLRLLSSLRKFQFSVDASNLPLNTERPVFDQIAPDRVYNIVARST